MSSDDVALDPQTLRRCTCPDAPELRWESPKRQMYSCPECGMWWEVPKRMQEEVKTDTIEAVQKEWINP